MRNPLRWLKLIYPNRATKYPRKLRKWNRCRLELERLEDRLPPAVLLRVNTISAATSLTDTTSGGSGVKVDIYEIPPGAADFYGEDGELAILLQGGTFDPASDPNGEQYLPGPGPTGSNIALVGLEAYVVFGAHMNFVATLPGDTLTFDSQGIYNTNGVLVNLTASAQTINVQGPIDMTKVTTGDGSVSLSAARNITVPGAITTSFGDINLTANTPAPASPWGSNFAGIDINGGNAVTCGSVKTTSGHITLTGTGGDSGSGNYGIDIHDGASVQATGDGKVTLTGTGGKGVQSNFGVFITNSSTVSTSNGALTVVGTGGQGSGPYDIGIDVYGSVVSQAGSGALTLTGAGKGSGSSNYGVTLRGGSHVSALGVLGLTLTGNGSTNGTDTNIGVQIQDPGTLVWTINSEDIVGSGGGSGGSNIGIDVLRGALVCDNGQNGTLLQGTGSGNNGWNYGIEVDTGAEVQATGGGSLIGTGGSAAAGYSGNNDVGVHIDGGGSQVITSWLDVWGKAGESASAGIQLSNGAGIVASGGVWLSGTSSSILADASSFVHAASLNTDSTGGATLNGANAVSSFYASNNLGGDITFTNTATPLSIAGIIQSGGGNVTVTNLGAINLIGTTSNPCTVSADGAGSVSLTAIALGNYAGIDVNNATVLTTGSGNVTLNGTGGNGGSGLQVGIKIENGAVVAAEATGNVTLNGIAGSGTSSTNSNYGVFIIGSTTQVTAVAAAGGNLTINGSGGQGGKDYNIGVDIWGALVSVTGGAGNLL